MANLFAWEFEDLPTEEQCREHLLPHVEQLNGAMHNAWDEWMSLPEASRLKVSAMQRGGVVHDFIVDHVIGLLTGHPTIEFPGGLPFFAVYVGGILCVRFKKLNQHYLVEPTTEMGKLYYNNAALPGLKAHCRRLSCGYVLDSGGSELLDVAITCQVRDELVWKWSIGSVIYTGAEGEHVAASDPPPPTISPFWSANQAEAE